MNSLLPEELNFKELRADRTVLAILTMDDEINLFRGNRSNFIDLIKTGQSMGFIVYVLTVKDLLFTRNSLIGFVYNEDDDSWQQRLLPFPEIIYNRIPQR